VQQQPTPAPTPTPVARTQVLQPTTAGGPYIVTAAPPQTAAELRVLRERRGELSDQITNVSNRRDRIANQLKTADPAARPGLEERLKVLDQRIVNLERELDITGEALRGAPAALVAATVSQGPDPAVIASRLASEIVPITAILSVFVFAPMALALSRFIWKRATAPPPAPMIDEAAQRRLDQLQQAVDTIAIEVERISEGQRFVTKLLSDGRQGAIAAASESGRPSRKATAADRG